MSTHLGIIMEIEYKITYTLKLSQSEVDTIIYCLSREPQSDTAEAIYTSLLKAQEEAL
jgi:hypothetical protein